MQLEKIKSRCEAATPPPWQAQNVSGIAVGLIHGVTDADAVFVGHAREDIPKLVTEIERLQTRIKKLTQDDDLVDRFMCACGRVYIVMEG